MTDFSDRITDAELVVMQVFWQASEPLTVAELVQKLCHTGWKMSTIKTLVRRLFAKGAIGADPVEEHHYRPLISRQDYGVRATKKLLDTVYQGDAEEMVRTVKQLGITRLRKKTR